MHDKNVLFFILRDFSAADDELLIVAESVLYLIRKMRAGYYGLIARNTLGKAARTRFIQFGEHVVEQKHGIFALFFAV